MNASSTGLILNVDDERLVRDSLSILLRADGYDVKWVMHPRIRPTAINNEACRETEYCCCFCPSSKHS